MTATKPARLPQLLSIRQVADYLGVSTRTIRREIKGGQLPGHRVGRQIRVREVDVAAYLARCLVYPEPNSQ